MKRSPAWRETTAFLLTFPPADQSADLAAVGRMYPWLAPLLAAACNAAVLWLGFRLKAAGLTTGLAAVVGLACSYLVRGLRLIDGFADLSDGLSLALTRRVSPETAWQVIRSPTRGAYGILWVGLLLLGQFACLQALLERLEAAALVLFTLSASAGSLSVLAAHLGDPPYHPDSSFGAFGKSLSAPRGSVVAGLEMLVLGGAAASLVFRGFSGFMLLLAAVLCAALTGRALCALVLAKLGRLNGDIVGFAALSAEIVTLMFLLALT